MNLQVEQSPPGANNLLYLPYLLGERSPRWNPRARGVYFGLTVQHNRADIIRATMEGITFNLRVILEAFQEQGAQIKEMRVIGGGARGRVWRQVLADIFGIPVVRPTLLEDATSMGAAIAGGVGVGIFPDFEIAARLTPIIDTARPDRKEKEKYDRLYKVFNECYQALTMYDLAQFNFQDGFFA
jgi:xylulokinase